MTKYSAEPPPETRFDVSDVSYLFERSDELAKRTREVIASMAKISRRIHEAIGESDKHLPPPAGNRDRQTTMRSDPQCGIQSLPPHASR